MVEIKEYCIAFMKAKKNFVKTGMSGHVKGGAKDFKYARLPEVYNAVEQALNEQDIIIQHCRQVKGEVEVLITFFIHIPSGQYTRDECLLVPEKPNNQSRAGAVTTMRKQAVLVLCGIATEEDDEYFEEEDKEVYITQEQKEHLEVELKKHPRDHAVALYRDITKEYKITSFAYLKASDYREVELKVRKG
jgi:hypothetical protein